MTEIIGSIVKHEVNLPAFIAAILMAPIVTCLPFLVFLAVGYLFSSILLFIIGSLPFGAIYFGGLAYLILGAPLLYWQWQRGPNLWASGVLSICAVGLALLLNASSVPILHGRALDSYFLIGLSCAFAPIWACTATHLFMKLNDKWSEK